MTEWTLVVGILNECNLCCLAATHVVNIHIDWNDWKIVLVLDVCPVLASLRYVRDSLIGILVLSPALENVPRDGCRPVYDFRDDFRPSVVYVASRSLFDFDEL
jgi:hypothetical protein